MRDKILKRAEWGNYVQYEDGEVIFEEGSADKLVYFIVNGEAEVSQRIGEEKQVMAVLQKGDFFGEMAPISDDVRSMTVTAIGDLNLYELTVDDMFQYMLSNPEIMRDVYVSLIERLQDTNLQVKELMLRTSAQSEEAPQVGVISQLRREIAEKSRKIEELQNQLEHPRKKPSLWRRRER